MRLMKLLLVIGLAGTLIGCDPGEDAPSPGVGTNVDSGSNTTDPTAVQEPATNSTTKPETPTPPVTDPPVAPTATSQPAPTIMPEPVVCPPMEPPVSVTPQEPLPEPVVFPTATGETTPPAEEAEASASTGGRAHNLTSADSGKTVRVGIGDTILIELDANPTTGYSWETKSADDAVLKQKSKQFLTWSQMNPEMQPAVGQGGRTTFTYQVTGPGKSTISLAYRRPREEDVEPAETFELAVEAAQVTSPTVTGTIIFSAPPDVENISSIVVSIRNTALADGPAPLIGTVELTPPFALPITFAVPYDPAKVRPNPMFYSISARVNTVVDGSEKLYYINDTRHHIFTREDDTKCDIKVKKIR